MKVILHCDEPLKEYHLPVTEVDPFVKLVEKYGFQDGEGYRYAYSYAEVDDDGSLTVYLKLLDE
jgi:hypothetical protein